MKEPIKARLLFQPGDRKEGFAWTSLYEDLPVGLCRQWRCQVCDLQERDRLRGFKGGNLEVLLTLHRKPTFLEELFWLGHIVKILPREPEIELVADEGLEVDGSRLNTVVYRTPHGLLLVDPGSLIFGETGDTFISRLCGNQRIIASLVTHGHLDHWNRLPQTRGPIYMPKTAFLLAARHAFWEKNGRLVNALRSAKKMTSGEPLILNHLPLKVEVFALSHSIPETLGLMIEGERARVVHLGDFRFNGFDSLAKARLINQLRKIARERVDYLALTIFNAHIPGFTPIEGLAVDALTDILIAQQGKRVIIACFATNLERISKIIEAARLLGRQVRFLGAGMRNCREMLNIGEVPASEGEVVFVTGCQAEEYSVLWRLANNYNPPLELTPQDTLVLSSRCIPGKEKALKELLQALGPRVGRLIIAKGEVSLLGLQGLGIEELLIHVSGHGSAEDLRLALEILRPKKIIAWPQIEPQIGAFREIVKPFGAEILPEDERIIDI